MAAFFERSGDIFNPSDFCRGPWNHDSLHGRAVAGLLAYGIEAFAPDDGWQIARLTVDMFRLAPHRPTTLKTRLLRDGNRIRSVEAALEIEGVEVARASGLILLASDVVPTSWGGSAAPVAPPSAGVLAGQEGEGPFGDHRDAWEIRHVRAEGERDPSVAWLRMAHPFVEGETTSAFVRTAAAADYANPHSNRSEPRQAFINADMTLHLFRYPASEWLGFEVAAHDSQGGIAIGSCVVRDLEGPVGRSTVATIANDRARMRAASVGVR
ncbi:MAG: thioesterase family protein [Dehalococcoidia bacterium]|nr:thioesterase family protein [Dehalococcoidia bacterium]